MKFLILLVVLIGVALAVEQKVEAEEVSVWYVVNGKRHPLRAGTYTFNNQRSMRSSKVRSAKHEESEEHEHRGDDQVKVVAEEVGDSHLEIKMRRKQLSLRMAPEKLIVKLY